MVILDMRFDSSVIQRWVGQEFKQYKCDAFAFTNSVTQIVGLYIGNEVYSLTNTQEAVDYFGLKEDIGVSRLSSVDDSQIKSAFEGVEMITTPVKETISSVKLVNEMQRMTKDGVVTHEVWLTRAVIISLGDREISFEKDTVPFSEEIIIQRGYDLIDKCSESTDFLESWDENYSPECKREIITLS